MHHDDTAEERRRRSWYGINKSIYLFCSLARHRKRGKKKESGQVKVDMDKGNREEIVSNIHKNHMFKKDAVLRI